MTSQSISRPIAGLCLLALSSAAVAAKPPVVLRNGIPHQALFAVAFDGANGVTVGAGGEIAGTQDGGKTWQPEQSPAKLALLGVAIKGSRRIAVGQMGLILVKDGDGEWKEVESGSTERLFSVTLGAQGLAVVTGSFGATLVSADDGMTWKSSPPDWIGIFAGDSARLGDGFAPHLYAASVNSSGRIIMAGELSCVFVSEDQGASWKVATRGFSREDQIDPTLFDLDMRDDSTGYAVGQSGAILKTTDGGATWNKLDSKSTANLLSIEAGDAANIVVSGMREMLASRDDGATWSKVRGEDLATGWYSGSARTVAGTVVVGNAGRVLLVAH